MAHVVICANFIGMADGLHESKEWIEREKKGKIREGRGFREHEEHNNNTSTIAIAITIATTVTMIAIITTIAYCNNSTNPWVYNRIIP